MYNTLQLYELSFVAPQLKPRTHPEIVFTIKAVHLPEIERRLQNVVLRRIGDYADHYCAGEVGFDFPVHDFGRLTTFGYGKCGFATESDGMMHLHLPLIRERLYQTTLTTKALTMALAVPISEQKSNVLQQADLEIRCSKEGRGYDHAVSGYVSSRIAAWLLAQASRSKEDKAVRMPAEVVKAMRYAWLSVCREGAKQQTSACGGRIEQDGKFQLGCLGADIAIYPDNGWHKDDMDSPHGVRFSCHNLDSAPQQLTLIAGFAKMCELARQAEDKN